MGIARRTDIVDNLVIGTGPSGLAAAMALSRRGASLEVIDVGYELEQSSANLVAQLASVMPNEWTTATTETLFPPVHASIRGVERRLAFGSIFPYRVPSLLEVSARNCLIDMSHAFGGFANVWGAAMLPFDAISLKSWPIPLGVLEEAYKRVLQYVPLCGERDALVEKFPLYTEAATKLNYSQQSRSLLQALNGRRQSLNGQGIWYGRSRLAVDASNGPFGCKYCGRCLDGCVYEAIFNPLTQWKKLLKSGLCLHKGYYAVDFRETDEHVEVRAVSVTGRGNLTLKTKRLFLAAGHIATTRMIASSFEKYNRKIRILDSQYFFFPLFAYKSATGDARFRLAEVFIEIRNQNVSDNYVHFQVYGKNEIFERALRLPPVLISPIANRLLLFQGFVHSRESGYLTLTVMHPRNGQQELQIEGVENPQVTRVARRSRSLIRKSLSRFGVIPPILVVVPPGRSFHSGGSFPMGGSDPFFSSDILGRPPPLKRVHIVDAASFPSIPASTIVFSIMANADRIVEACMTS